MHIQFYTAERRLSAVLCVDENSEIRNPMLSELSAATADSVDAEDKVPATFAAKVQITPRGPHVQDTYSSSASG
jgi:hypothetical protein